MSNEPTITCPKCKKEIRLTESLAAPLVEATRQKFEAKLAEQDADILSREQRIAEDTRALQQKVDSKVAEQLKVESARLLAQAKQASAAELAARTQELTTLQETLQAQDAKLASAQAAQAELINTHNKPILGFASTTLRRTQ